MGRQSSTPSSTQSRVHQIYQAKKEGKNNFNQFYQSRTGSSLRNYQTRIDSYREYRQTDAQRIASLEHRLAELKLNTKQKQEQAAEINQEINRLKQEAKLENSLIRSQMRSKSSLSARSARSLNAEPAATPALSLRE